MVRSYTARLGFIVFAACLWAPRGFEAHAGEHTVTFDVNGTPFHVPKAWVITISRSDPPYSPSRAISPGQVFQTDQGIMINFFSDRSTSPSHRYPEITPPFPYEIVIDVTPPDAPHPQRRDKAVGNPVLTEQLAGRALDPDGFVKLGEQRYVGAQADDDDGMGGYLEFSCQAGLTDADSAVSRRCTTYIYVDAIRIRTVFDGAKYAKPDWRSAPRQAVALIKWLIIQPDKRSERIREF